MKHDNKLLLTPIVLALLAMKSPVSPQQAPEPAKPATVQPVLLGVPSENGI